MGWAGAEVEWMGVNQGQRGMYMSGDRDGIWGRVEGSCGTAKSGVEEVEGP